MTIAARLRGFDNAEDIARSGHRQICQILARHLEKHPILRPSFVGLSGGVKKARPEARACGDMFRVRHRIADGLESRVMRETHLELGQQSELILPCKLVQMGVEIYR